MHRCMWFWKYYLVPGIINQLLAVVNVSSGSCTWHLLFFLQEQKISQKSSSWWCFYFILLLFFNLLNAVLFNWKNMSASVAFFKDEHVSTSWNGLFLSKYIHSWQLPPTSHMEACQFVAEDHSAQLCLRIVQWLEGLASKALDLESKV